MTWAALLFDSAAITGVASHRVVSDFIDVLLTTQTSLMFPRFAVVHTDVALVRVRIGCTDYDAAELYVVSSPAADAALERLRPLQPWDLLTGPDVDALVNLAGAGALEELMGIVPGMSTSLRFARAAPAPDSAMWPRVRAALVGEVDVSGVCVTPTCDYFGDTTIGLSCCRCGNPVRRVIDAEAR